MVFESGLLFWGPPCRCVSRSLQPSLLSAKNIQLAKIATIHLDKIFRHSVPVSGILKFLTEQSAYE